MSALLISPVVVPFLTAIVAFALRKHRNAQRWASVTGALLLLALSGVLLQQVWTHRVISAQIGNWEAPFGITLAVDTLSALMVLVTAVCGFAIQIYSLADIDSNRERFGYHSMYHILIGGVCGAFVTGDLFNMYVWFEVLLISSFALLVLGGTREQLDGAVKYVAVNLISTLLFIGGIGLLYGLTGSLNFADLHARVAEVENKGLLTTVAVLFIVAFGIKSAVFPLFSWLPASYHTPPVAVSAIFSGLLTKVGVYALIRMFTIVFYHDPGYTHTLLLGIAGFTMLSGVLGAASQYEIRRILSFHIVSQIGYMVMGLALCFATPLALVGAIFYILHHIVVKANLFLIGGVCQHEEGTAELRTLGSLYRNKPLLAVLFLIPALSLAGFPPLSGFWAKFAVIKASLDVDSYLIAFTALFVGLFTVYSMTKIWSYAFWSDPEEERPARPALGGRQKVLLYAPIVFLAMITVSIGLFPGPLMAFSERAAQQLLEPTDYVTAIMEARPK